MYCYRHPNSADIALLEASVCIKGGSLAAADLVLTGLKSDSSVTALRTVLMRAQMAVTSDKQQQVTKSVLDKAWWLGSGLS